MQNKLLIYIPSYNRAESLLRQLSALSGSSNRGLFDVAVSNNCSTDMYGYSDIERLCLQNEFLYSRNGVNVGADANIFNGFLISSKYEYLWILSDDDLLRDGAVDGVLDMLSNSPDVLFFTHSKKTKLETAKWRQHDLLLNNIYTSDGAGLISNVIYSVSFIKDSIPIGFQSIYTCFAHLSVLIGSFRKKEANVVLIGSHLFFLPDTEQAPENAAGYSKSYFGFVLLGETLEDDLKKEFVNKYASFWNLRHWAIKSKDSIAFPNVLYAKAYILKYAYLSNFVRFKLLFWKIATPILQYIKHNTSSDFRKALRSKIGIKF